MSNRSNTHSLAIGYVLWIFGFLGAHRFYYGKPVSGCIWFFTGGLLLIGWIVDLFLMPSLDAQADRMYGNQSGPKSYNVAWVFLTFLGLFGFHRFYLGKWVTGIIWLVTGGFFIMGYLYDFCTLNGQVYEVNSSYRN